MIAIALLTSLAAADEPQPSPALPRVEVDAPLLLADLDEDDEDRPADAAPADELPRWWRQLRRTACPLSECAFGEPGF